MRRYSAFFLIPLAIAMLGAGCGGSSGTTEAAKPVTLNWWGVYEDQDAVQPLINAYRTQHPNVSIEYRALRSSEYEQALVNALAEDRGPDIFALHNTWIPKYQAKLAFVPDSYSVPFTTIEGTVKKIPVTRLVTKQGISIRSLKSTYVDTVAADVVRPSDETPAKDRIYALPLSGDNLALFYNKDLLNLAGIAQPPQFWTEFQNDVKKLTKQNAQGNIVQSGAGIGTAKNVLRAADILSLLMMQNGARMTDENGFAYFQETPPELQGREVPPADEASIFYTDFANPAKEVYTWNDKLADSLEAFSQGKTAFFLGYSFNINDIRARAPKLNFGIGAAPQIEGNPQVNYANYWVQAVSKKSKSQNWAWDFVQSMTSAEQAGKYVEAAHTPTVLRSLLGKQLEDVDLSVFANQMLTARAWYRGKNETEMEAAFAELINTVLAGADVHRAVVNAVNRVNESYK
jgi:multiple sugar transport system substrate-binding protein